jgi:hypothetical protein
LTNACTVNDWSKQRCFVELYVVRSAFILIIIDGNGVYVDFRVVGSRNDELHKAIWIDELFVRWGLSLDESDIS